MHRYYWQSPRRRGDRKVFHCAGLSKLGRKSKGTNIESYSIAKLPGVTLVATTTTAPSTEDSLCAPLQAQDCRLSDDCTFDKETKECRSNGGGGTLGSNGGACAAKAPAACRSDPGCKYDKATKTCGSSTTTVAVATTTPVTTPSTDPCPNGRFVATPLSRTRGQNDFELERHGFVTSADECADLCNQASKMMCSILECVHARAWVRICACVGRCMLSNKKNQQIPGFFLLPPPPFPCF